MKILLIVLAVLALASAGLFLASCTYTSRVEQTYPPIGQMLTVDGQEMHIRVRPGPDTTAPVVLIHGASANLREFESNLVPGLSGKVPLLSIDRPGHGYSQRPNDGDELGVQARLIAGAMRETYGSTPVVLVGHSFGGAVSLRVALDYPEQVKGLVLLAPATHPWSGGTTWYNNLAAMPVIGAPFSWLVTQVGPSMADGGIDSVFKPNEVPENYAENLGLPLLFRPKNFRANGRDLVAATEEFTAQAKRYSTITAPVVIFSPSEDHVLSPKIHAYPLSKEVDNADLRILEDTGHMPHHTHTREVVDAILALSGSESGQ